MGKNNRETKRSYIKGYFLAGFLALGFELSVLALFKYAFDFSAEASVTISFWSTLAVSFGLQKVLAFQDYQKTINVLSKQIGLYTALVLFNYLFTVMVASLFPDNMVIISRVVSLTFITGWNYFIYKNIFSKNISGHFLKNNLVKSIGFFILLTLPILLYCYQYLSTGDKLADGDFDYYAQLYEAFRKSVVEFGQFPAWNPWMSGGIPLFDNPQFGLISIQSLAVLILGTVFGLKIAYVLYMILGFWGMYILCRRIFQATVVRSALISYIWIFSSFFAAHGIFHFTFSSFFLIPWLIYFIAMRRSKWAWLWLGLSISILILSSLHYAFLMSSLTLVFFFIFTWLYEIINRKKNFKKTFISDLVFLAKTSFIVIIFGGYRMITTYLYLEANERPASLLEEDPNPVSTILKALFLPYDSILDPPQTHWGWWEYTGYMGMGTTLALLFSVGAIFVFSLKIRKITYFVANPTIIWPILSVAFIAFLFTLGDFHDLSPYHLLKQLPGFTETRVSSRWIVFVILGFLLFLAALKKSNRLINLLLLFSVIELFITFGPPRKTGDHYFSVNDPLPSSEFQQYDNGFSHSASQKDKHQSYYYTTSKNIGQIYSDDSMINTLNKVFGTKRCGLNKDPSCDLVLSDNANIQFWSPNKIVLQRTSPGEIKLNVNRDKGWRINDQYIYRDLGILDPNVDFILPEGQNTYFLEYSPKYSPGWFAWRLQKTVKE